MSKKGSLKEFLSVIVAVMIIISSLPISSVYAATKETEECVDCSGTGTVACTDCVGGYKTTVCTICSGTGLFEENPCEACDGTGKEKCETCSATGFVVCSICNGTGEIEVEYEICPVCNGDKKCTTCAGEGTVKIPCSNSVCNNGKIDVDCPDCEDGKIEVSCSNCSGTGNVSKIVSTPCTTCGGTGLLADDSDCPDCEDGMVESLQDVDCDQCVAGKIEQDCSTCGGVGTIQQNCTVCGGTGEIDSVCHDCSGDKKCANCLGTGKIKTVADTSFDFNEATPSNIKVGDIFENIASSSNNTTGTVSYEVDDDTIAVITNDGKLTAKRVGTVTVTAKIVTDYTFSSAETTYTITIDKATPVISGISATAITYGQKLSDSTVSAVAKVGTTEISGRFAWADSVKNEEPTVVTDSDNTEYEAVFTPDDTDNYTTATFKAKVTVKKANITGITVKGCNHVYDENAVDAVSVSGLEASDTVKYSTDNGNTYQTSMPKLTNVNDSKTVYVSVTRDGNYNDYVTGVPAVVSPAKIDGVSFNVYSGTYDGEEHPAVTLSGPGYKESDTVTYKYNGNSYSELNFKEEGRYEVEVIISRTDNNYKETKFPDETDVKFVVDITLADVTVKANDVTKEYTGSELPSEEDKSISVSGNLVEGHNVTAKVNGSGTTVGEYILTPSDSDIVIRDAEGNDVTKNYNISTENGILDITKRPLKITANNVNATYNAKPYNSNVFYEKLEDRYSQEGLVEGQTIVTLTIDGEKTAVNSYSGLLVPSGAVIKSGDEETTSNYDIEYVSGDMTISYLEISDVNEFYTVNDANDFGWYNDKVVLTAKDGYKLCYTKENADSFTDYVEYAIEGVNNPKVAVMEIATGYITDILDCNQVKIDTVNPNVFNIEYKTPLAYKLLEAVTFGIYNAPTVATIYASDATSNIKSVSYKLTGADYVDVDVADMTFDEGKYSYEIVIPKSFKGQVQYYATDNSGLKSEIKSDDNGIIVDVTDPAIDEIDYNTTIFRDNKYYYSGDAVVDFAVNDEYFFAEYMDSAKIDLKAIDSAVTVKVTKNGEDYTNFEKVLDETSKTISVKIPSLNNDGDYVIDLTYADPAGNSVNVKTDTLVIDTTAPVVTVSYDNNTPSNEKYFNTDRVATITVVEHDFFAEDFIAEFEAKDIKGNDVTVEDYAAKLKNDDEWNHNGDIHTINLKYTVDANYTYSFISYKDAAENDNEYSFADGSVATNDFVIDHIKPTNVEITYSDSVLEEILGAVTFGFYKEKCEVTLTTTDATSPIDYFSYSYDVNDPVNTGNVGGSNSNAVAVVDADDASKFTTKFDIPAQFRGQVTATATDMATNESNSVTDAKTIVTDTISPVMSVSYSLADNTKNGVDYYNKDVTVTINVTDENFIDGEYPSEVNDIVIRANIEDENKVVTYETYSVTNWTRVNNTDEWQGTFTLSTEGDYTLSISYADKSGNAMADYSRDKLTIDKTKPVITAEYNTPVQKVSKDGNEVSYYNDTVGMKLTVVEHNFDASYFASKINATDVNNNIISEANEAIQKFVEKDSNWSSSLDGNTHTIVVPIEDVEANYLVDYELCDLAINYADEPTVKKLTYDITNPEIELSIKATVVRKILNGITFGIFDKNVNADITITATDEISGIERIEYSTYATQNVIGKIDNTKLDISNVIIADNIQTSDGVTTEQENGKQVVKYKFTVAPEFRNKIMSTAYDYSTNSSTIDNIINHEDGLNYNGVIKDVEESKIELSVDESAPYASIDTFADNFNFYVNISDTNAGIAKIEADINGKTILVDNANNVISNIYAGEDTKDKLIESASFAINTSQADKANDGVYVLTVKVTDNANNTISKSYTAYIDVWSPMVTDFSFESSGKAYTGDDAYIYGEKLDVIDKDTNIYNYYFEKTTKVTVYVYDYEKTTNATFNQHTAGIKDIALIAENRDGNPVNSYPVEGSFVQTTEDGIGYSQMTFVVEGPFKGNLYAIATDYAGNYPTIEEEHGLVAPGYKSMISEKYDGYVNPYDTIIESIEKHSSTSSISIVPKTDTESTQTYAYQFKYEGNAQVRDEKSKIDYIDSQKVPLYNSNVEFNLTVEDTYSGIRQVKWSVIGQEDQDADNNQEGIVTINNIGQIVSGSDNGWIVNSEDSNLVTSISKQITVKNNSNDIVILIELTDRAGNTSYDYYVLGIDKTAAKVTVELDKNASNGKYFNESRVVTVTVEERNFDPASFDLTIKKNDDATPSVNGANLKWNHSAQDIDAVNATTHIATYTISPEGDYKIEASNIDIAGNETNNKSNVKPQYKGDAPTNFIIDKTQPETNVSMTGTSKNEKYFFNEDRTVTIVVTDRNFNPNDVSLRITSNGAVYSPKLNWKQDQSGSQRTNTTTNTATFTISNEADYTFNFSCVDKAQNASKSTKYATDDCQKFTIDKTAPTVAISQVVYQSANNGRDEQGNEIKIPLTVTVKDTNIGNLYSNNSVTSKEVSEKLNVSQLNGISTDSSFKQSTASRDTIIYTTSNIENDGIYTLNLDIQDCAGNKMNSITYNSSKDKSSTQTVLNGNSNFFTFSVNRNGSTYGIDENTANLVKTYYVQNVTHDVKIVETNVDKLVGNDLKSNVKVVKDGQVDPSVSSFVKVENISTSSAWQKYTYIIDKAYFEPEATYEISIQSMDTANNAGYSDLKLDSDSIKFVVDRTVPVVSIVGITSDTSYFKASQDVSITISDDVLLSKIQIFINDNIELELEAKDFGAYFVDGKFVWNYTVANDDGTNKISVVCYDAAGNANTDENEVAQKSTIDNFLVTTNRGEIAKFWIINHVVQTAIIAVVIVGTVAGIVWFVLYRRKFRKTPKE